MSQLKPFIRISILSMILTMLLIYLGIQYHWGDYFKKQPDSPTVLEIPKKQPIVDENDGSNNSKDAKFNPEIIEDNNQSVLDSMTKGQIAEHCSSLLSKQINDSVTLELATVNCVMSNYQETFQNINEQDKSSALAAQKKNKTKKYCARQIQHNKQLTSIEKELLIGICVSDSNL